MNTILPPFTMKTYGATKATPIKMREKDIQDQILQWFSYQKNVFVWRQNAGSMFVDGPTGRHGFRSASVRGISDILGIWNGYPIAVEVKQPKKKPTELQRGFLKDFARAGGIALVVHSLEELQNSLAKILRNEYRFDGVYEENA